MQIQLVHLDRCVSSCIPFLRGMYTVSLTVLAYCLLGQLVPGRPQGRGITILTEAEAGVIWPQLSGVGAWGRDCLLCQQKALGVPQCPMDSVLFASQCLGESPVVVSQKATDTLDSCFLLSDSRWAPRCITVHEPN